MIGSCMFEDLEGDIVEDLFVEILAGLERWLHLYDLFNAYCEENGL